MSRKTLRSNLRTVAIILSMVMLIFSSPFSAFATGTEILEINEENVTDTSEQTETASETDTSELVYESVSHVSDELIGNVIEVNDRREENVKHFALADGTYEAVVYSDAVHRKDENGVWQDIDNRLIESDGKYSTSDGRVTFSANIPALTLTENGYTIVMEYAENTSQSGNISSETVTFDSAVVNAPARADRFDSLDEAKTVNNASSITYATANRASIEYILDGNDVKENIIISGVSSSYEYFFKLVLTGLTASLADNGDILLCDGENVKYTIPAPFMYDANGNISYDAAYELVEIKSGAYAIRLTASSEWINAEDRAFPVTLDPSITSRDSLGDTYVSSAEPNVNYGDEDELKVGQGYTAYIKLNDLLFTYGDIT